MNQSFDTNVEAVTHDSDPKLLNFDLLDVGGNVVNKLGSIVDLRNAKPVGSGTPGVVGPTLPNLTGGSTNSIVVTLQPTTVPLISQISSGSIELEINFSDATYVNFTVGHADLVALATAQGVANLGSAAIDITSLVPGWAGFSTKSISGIVWNSGSGAVNFNTTPASTGSITGELQIGEGVDVLKGLLPIPALTNVSVSPIQPVFANPVMLTVTLATTFNSATVTMPIDATTLKTTSDFGPFSPGQQFAMYRRSVDFVPYVGWNITEIDVNILTGYAAEGAIDQASYFNWSVGSNNPDVPFLQMTYLGDTPPQFTHTNFGLPTVVDTNTSIFALFSLLPASSPPSTNPLLWTEPYELRQRNRPAFKIVVKGPNDETNKAASVFCFGSQGPFTPDRKMEWTWLPSICVGTGQALVNAGAHIPMIDPNATVAELPHEYQGWSILLGQGSGVDVKGPWNYIRFLIVPGQVYPSTDPVSYYDLTGYSMEIVANAREL